MQSEKSRGTRFPRYSFSIKHNDEWTYKVKFRKFDKVKVECCLKVINSYDNEIVDTYYGIANCHAEDTFNFNEGKRISFEKALSKRATDKAKFVVKIVDMVSKQQKQTDELLHNRFEKYLRKGK